MKIRSIIFLIIGLSLIGCSGEIPTPAVEATSTPTDITVSPFATEKVPPTLIPTKTITPENTPAPQSECPQPGNPQFTTFPDTPADLKEMLIAYLNMGGTPYQFSLELNASQFKQDYPNQLEIIPVDISGDGVSELFVLTEMWGENIVEAHNNHESAVWVLGCSAGEYKTLGLGSLGGGYYGWEPEIISIGDLNHDNRMDVIVQVLWGGSGCATDFVIVSWGDLGMKTILDETFECQTELISENIDDDPEIELQFIGLAEVKSYPAREFIYTYDITHASSFKRVSENAPPSDYRFYVLADAQKALDEKDFSLALQLYEQAANDSSLKEVDSYPYLIQELLKQELEWPHDLPEIDRPELYLPAFALFRQMVLNLELDEIELAQSILEELEEKYHVGEQGYEFVEIADIYLTEKRNGKFSSESCQIVTSFIEEKYLYLDWHFDWDVVFDHPNDTICPFGE